jgi:hypothetical protein
MNNYNYNFAVRINRKDATEYNHGGETFIEGRKNSEYELYFRNNQSRRVKVIFSVDGLSVIDGKPASAESTGYVVNGYDSITVPGWKINDGKVAKFVFRPQGEKDNGTYVEKLKDAGFNVDAGNQGVIGCMVFKEQYYPPVSVFNIHSSLQHPNDWNYYQNNYVSPAYTTCSGGLGFASGGLASGAVQNSMQTMAAVGGCGGGAVGGGSGVSSSAMRGVTQSFVASETSSTPLGTGQGADKSFKTTSVSFIRESSTPDWVAVIHYDTLTGLRRRGILIENKKPNAFPGYNSCPDLRNY